MHSATRVLSFKLATEWAQQILLDPQQKTYYQQRAKVLKLPNAYTAALTDYMRKAKVVKTQHRDTIMYEVSKPGFQLKEVSVTSGDGAQSPDVVIRQEKDRWLVHYKPSANTEHFLTLTDNYGRITKLALLI